MQNRTVTLDEFREMLTERGYSAVSRESGVDVSVINRFAHGRAIQTDTLKRLIAVLSVKVLID
jgi:hypothetical protein